MDSTGLLEAFRLDTNDLSEPYLWSDDEIFGYMNDAQSMFCRKQGGIADATSAITTVLAPAGTVYASISPLILKLRAARRLSDGRDLTILNFEDLQHQSMGDDYGARFSGGFRLDELPGPLTSVVVGMETNKIRLINVPSVDDTIKLIVYRLPLEVIEDEDQPFEIDEQHHRHLLHWMKHLAHLKQDAETYDRGRSDMFRAEFLAYCDQAKAEREKREHKYRSVAYGGY